jgi:hypothetical protein
LLRIYFLADAHYEGEHAKGVPWTGTVAWAGKVSDGDRKKLLELLKLPATTGPAQWWLTEFEDNWSYELAPHDVYFTPSAAQDAIRRDPIYVYVPVSYPTDGTAYAFAGVAVLIPIVRCWRRRAAKKSSAC